MRLARAWSRAPIWTRSVAVALCWAGLVVSGCDSGSAPLEEADELAWQSLLFDNTIAVSNTGMTNGHSQPAVSWKATDEKHVVCALFSERIGVTDNEISNSDKIVWIWHSGLGKGHEGNVLWAHGLGDPKPLAQGTYFWAVWAFSDEGLPSWSSTEIIHTVK